jgi:hypothetical protein
LRRMGVRRKQRSSTVRQMDRNFAQTAFGKVTGPAPARLLPSSRKSRSALGGCNGTGT